MAYINMSPADNQDYLTFLKANPDLSEMITWLIDRCFINIAGLSPDDVFSAKELEKWAEDNNYIYESDVEEKELNDFSDFEIKEYARDNFSVDEVFKDSEIGDYVEGAFSPDEIFSNVVLARWALDNGFKEVEE